MTSAGVVLAAGSSTRMGRPKQLLTVDGTPMLQRIVAAACGSKLDEVVVVLGAHADDIQAAITWGRARSVLNPEHASGMSTSLQTGIRALGPEVGRAMMILGDQPMVSPALLDRILEAQVSLGLPAAALSVAGLLHPPVVLDRKLWADVMQLRGDVGCRDFIRARPELVAAVDAVLSGDYPIDLDNPEDLRRYASSRSGPA